MKRVYDFSDGDYIDADAIEIEFTTLVSEMNCPGAVGAENIKKGPLADV